MYHNTMYPFVFKILKRQLAADENINYLITDLLVCLFFYESVVDPGG